MIGVAKSIKSMVSESYPGTKILVFGPWGGWRKGEDEDEEEDIDENEEEQEEEEV